MAPSPLRASLRQALKPESILAHLDAEPVFSLDAPPPCRRLCPANAWSGNGWTGKPVCWYCWSGPARPRKAAACAPGCRAASF